MSKAKSSVNTGISPYKEINTVKRNTQESPNFFLLKSVNPTFVNKQNNVLIYQKKLTCEFFKIILNKQKLIFFFVFHC